MATANRKGKGRGSHGGARNTGNPSSSALGLSKTRKVNLNKGISRTTAVRRTRPQYGR